MHVDIVAAFSIFGLFVIVEYLVKISNVPVANTAYHKLQSKLEFLILEKRKYNTPDGFVKASKIQRNIDRLKEALKSIPEPTSPKYFGMSPVMMKYIVYVVALALWWDTWIVTFTHDPLFPVSLLLALPSLKPGGIGVLGWMFVCTNVSSRVVEMVIALQKAGEDAMSHGEERNKRNKMWPKANEGRSDKKLISSKQKKSEDEGLLKVD